MQTLIHFIPNSLPCTVKYFFQPNHQKFFHVYFIKTCEDKRALKKTGQSEKLNKNAEIYN